MTARRTRLVLVRHGVATDAHGRCIGHTDLPLSPGGRAAVAELARSWQGAVPSRLVTSDLARAAASARILADAWRLIAEPEARLREMFFGEWDGRSWRELGEADGTRLAHWMADWSHEATPGGEGFPDVAARAAAWLAELRVDFVGGETIVAVAHAGSIRALLSHLLGWTPAQAFHARLDHAGVTALELGPGLEPLGADLLCCNATTFPPPPANPGG